jgi:amidophosphoribosyltransferase
MKIGKELSPCIFEYIYFARPDSRVFGAMVDDVRKQCGRELAREHPIPRKKGVDVVVMAIPDSANTCALGYQRENLQLGYVSTYEFGIIRNHYIGRTFITPSQNARELKVRCKFNIVQDIVQNKIVVLLDDSIVRGTTSRLLAKMCREAGALEVHFRIASPQVISPCYYGMDFPSREELVANRFQGEDEVAAHLGVDSLRHLSVEGMLKAVKTCRAGSETWCKACFTGEYPVPVDIEDALAIIPPKKKEGDLKVGDKRKRAANIAATRTC